jgi:ABC-type uncharacterized transport system ATPase subunit
LPFLQAFRYNICMSAITVSHLQKTFQSKRKAAGLGGSLRALIRPQYSQVDGVREV